MDQNSFKPLTITQPALYRINQVIEQKQLGNDIGLRVGIRGGNCGVEDYLLGFDSKKETDDEYFLDGLRILIDKRHSLHVLGMEIDWFEDENQKGFVFNNPVKRK